MNPLVSIVIPVYNGANYLRQAIDSALAQTYENCEIIVVNDGSTDNTEQICLSYGTQIQYYYKENGGVATAINVGIKKMRGEYFSWLSHDDLYYPDKIKCQIQALKADINKEIVIGNFDFLNMESGSRIIFDLERKCDPAKLNNGIYPSLYGIIHACVMLVSKKRIDDAGLLDESLYTTQDIEWIFRLLRGVKTIFIKKPLIAVRLHQQQGKHQLKMYDEEQGRTHINLLGRVTDNEIIELFGSRYMFFYQMAAFYKRDNNKVAFNYARKQFECSVRPLDLDDFVDKLHRKIVILGNGITNGICVFGAGNCGSCFSYELLAREVVIDCMADNNAKLCGSFVNGIPVVSPDDLDKEKMLIIVAVEHNKILIEELLDRGFRYVVPYQSLSCYVRASLPKCIPVIDNA